MLNKDYHDELVEEDLRNMPPPIAKVWREQFPDSTLNKAVSRTLVKTETTNNTEPTTLGDIKISIFDQMTFNGNELLSAELPETNWAIQGLLPSGLTLLAGAPKLGKSWLVFWLSLSIATGTTVLGQIPTDVGDVLYLALEDTPARLRERLSMMTGSWDVAPNLERLHLTTRWMRLDEEGLLELRNWIAPRKDQLKLVTIDTLARIRPRRGNGTLYEEDYAALTGLKRLADEFGIAIIVVHHTRKSEAEDPLEMISGTNGLAGAADNILILKRESGMHDAGLYVRGRDVEEQDLALQWDKAGTAWKLLGDANDYRHQDNLKVEILKALATTDGPIGPKPLANLMGRSDDYSAIKTALWRMSQDGLVVSANGKYRLKGGDAPTLGMV